MVLLATLTLSALTPWYPLLLMVLSVRSTLAPTTPLTRLLLTVLLVRVIVLKPLASTMPYCPCSTVTWLSVSVLGLDESLMSMTSNVFVWPSSVKPFPLIVMLTSGLTVSPGPGGLAVGFELVRSIVQSAGKLKVALLPLLTPDRSLGKLSLACWQIARPHGVRRVVVAAGV